MCLYMIHITNDHKWLVVSKVFFLYISSFTANYLKSDEKYEIKEFEKPWIA